MSTEIKITEATLTELITRALEFRVAEIHVGMPARVIAWHPDRQQVDVQPLLKRIYRAADGTREISSYPVLPNVPVEFPAFGGWRLSAAIAVGDLVELRFQERSIDRWDGTEVEPTPARKHHLSDAVAVPGIRPPNRPLPGLVSTDLVLGREDGSVELRLTADGAISLGPASAPTVQIQPDGSIALGPSAAEPVVLGSALLSWLTSHTHPTTAPGSPTAPPLPPPPASLLSLKAKVL